MSKQMKSGRVPNTAFEFLRPGESVPRAFLERRIASAKAGLTDRSKAFEIGAQYALYENQLRAASKDSQDNLTKRALKNVLDIHKGLSRKALAATAPKDMGGVFGNGFRLTVTPPYDYAFTIDGDRVVGSPQLQCSANKDTGLLTARAITDHQSASSGEVYSEVGIYFRPKSHLFNVSISVNPVSTNQWWTNSILGKRVLSDGFSMFGIDTPGAPRPYGLHAAFFDQWYEKSSNELRFGSQSGVVSPGSLYLGEWLPEFEFAVFVGTTSSVLAEGWPGSLAGCVRSVNVPSLTVEVTPLLVAT